MSRWTEKNFLRVEVVASENIGKKRRQDLNLASLVHSIPEQEGAEEEEVGKEKGAPLLLWSTSVPAPGGEINKGGNETRDFPPLSCCQAKGAPRNKGK